MRIPGCLPPSLRTLEVDYVGMLGAAFEDPQNWLLPRVITDAILRTIKNAAPDLERLVCGKALYSHRDPPDTLVTRVHKVATYDFT